MNWWLRGPKAAWVLVGAAAMGAYLMACGSNGKNEPQGQQPAPLCATASTCAKRVYCDVKQNCRCLLSAEGDVRCGTPPSCSIKKCTKSSDCADLGEGYFCDSPKSGCCGDDMQRCIPPCMGTTCPHDRICAGQCCPEGEACVANKCTGSSDAGADGPMMSMPISGTWNGSIKSQGDHPVPVKFELVEGPTGGLTGRMYVEDPKTHQFLIDAELTGLHSGSSANWSTSTNLVVRGTITASNFTGTLQFPADGDFAAHTAQLDLRR